MNALEEVILPSSLLRINDGAFAMNGKLTSIYLQENIIFVGHFVFFGCHSLTITYQGESIPVTWMSSWNEDNRPIIFERASLPIPITAQNLI